MTDADMLTTPDTLINPEEPKSSAFILDALIDSEKAFRDYNEIARRIDAVYSARSTLVTTAQDLGLTDQEYDTFWASMEVLKPAIYAKAPKVVAKPRFSDATSTDKVVAELIERVVNSEFERTNIDQHMREVRDDLALLNRGVLRVTYETDGGKRICVDHVDRLDYRHEPVRYWSELGWEAFGAWLTETEMRDRFAKHSKDAYKRASYLSRNGRNDDDGANNGSLKCLVWEVWSKTENRVFWVTEGVDVLLDESKPYLDLKQFFPGPRPAYGTLRRRTLIPVPDYIRYERHLDQINFLTSKIYTLLERVRVVGIFAGSGDQGLALETAIADMTATAMFIPVPAGLMQNGSGDLIQWLPIDLIATTIQGLIDARSQLFADFDRLSGISDIMRGETEAEETLGAQRIKTQYGSVRVKDKTEEIIRLARDVACIAVEIICSNYDQKTLLEISQMDIPSRKDVDRDIAELKKAAQGEMKALAAKAQEMAAQAQQGGEQVDPAQAEQQFKQAQAQIAEKYAPEFQRLQNTVVIEDVMKVIKDKRERGLIIDIETDSTVMVDEFAQKQAATELLTAFSNAMSTLMPVFALGDAGVKLAMSVLSFTLQPFTRGNRQIEQQLEELIEQAPDIAARMQAQQGGSDSEGLVEAQKGLAEAEKIKAQAAMAGVQAKSELDKAEMQRKVAQMQIDAQNAQQKSQQEVAKLQLQLEKQQQEAADKAAMTEAQINKLTADTAKILASIGLDERKQQLSEYTAASQAQAQQVDQALAVEGQQQDAQFRAREHERADRNQDFTEQSSDRQMSLAEQQAERDRDGS